LNTKSPIVLAAALGGFFLAYSFGDSLGDMVRKGFGGKGPAEGAAESVLPPAEAALFDKLQPHIKCLNEVDAALRTNYSEYRENFDGLVNGSREEVLGFTQFKIQVYEKDNAFTKECADALDAAIKIQPGNEVLDKNGEIYAKTLRALIPLMNEAEEYYYSQEDYLDDAMAKGKELDAKMAPLFTTLFAASDAISLEVDTQSLILRQKELAAMEAEYGRDFDWHLANVMLESRKLIDALDAEAEAGTLSEAKVAELEAGLQKAYDEAKAYAAANPDVKTSLGNKPLWFDMEGYLANILGEVKDLRRALATNPNPNEEFDAVFEEYNSAIDDYNMLANLGR
jgi:hypothetical protein